MFFLSNLCLLCLNKNSNTILIEDNEITLVQKKIQFCLPELIGSYSESPKYICKNCMNKLDCFYIFKETCLRNNTNLKNYLQTLSPSAEKTQHLSVRVTDIKQQSTSNCQTFPIIVESDNEHEVSEIFIKQEPNISNDLLNDITIKEEVDDIEYCPEFVQCGTFTEESEVSVSDNTNELKKVVKLENNTKKITFQCTICNKEYLHRISLNYHLKVHAGVKDLSCFECNKKFLHRSHLIEHEKIHTGVKDFECKICHKKFVRKSILTQHEVVHTGVKNFECTFCKKRFRYKHDLFRHENIHTGKRNYQCMKCNKNFTQKSSLKTHGKKCKKCIQK